MIKDADCNKKPLNNVEGTDDGKHVGILLSLVEGQANCAILILNYHISR
jgi:hypothetical protein